MAERTAADERTQAGTVEGVAGATGGAPPDATTGATTGGTTEATAGATQATPTPETQGAASAAGRGPSPGSTAPGTADEGVTPDIVRSVLRKVKDPELNLNIIDLGLVYDVRVDGTAVSVDMSLTSPGCPSGPEIMGEAERQIAAMPGVSEVSVNLVWTPFWSPDRIEPRVRAYLGI